MVVQVSRGVSPVAPIAEACGAALRSGAGYALLSGMMLVDAKNKAVEYAEMFRCALVLVEDDIQASVQVWEKVLDFGMETVLVGSCPCRNGEPNTKFRGDGSVWYAGTALVRLPYSVLARLPRPTFVAMDHGIDEGRLVAKGPNDRGRGSDTHLFYLLEQLQPRPVIAVAGEVTHLMHPMNRERHDLRNPCEVTAA